MITTLSFCQWNWQNPLPNGHRLNDVKMISSDTIIAVGDYGTIMRSVDGGNTWFTKNLPGIRSFDKVFFTDNQHGWAVGGDNSWSEVKIFHTVDKGENWTLQSVVPDWPYVEDASFPDDKNGWLIASWGLAHTNNGGETWESQNLPNSFWGYRIFFSDSLTGWMTGADTSATILFKTINGGVSWTKLDLQMQHCFPQDILFTDESNGWFLVSDYNDYSSKIYKSNDGGINWSLSYSGPLMEISAYALFFNNLYNGWAVGWSNAEQGSILYTADAGLTWSFQNSELAGDGLLAIDFIDMNSGVIVGSSGIILKSENEGISWERKTKGNVNIGLSIDFSNLTTGYCVGHFGTICKTIDGGFNWSSLNTGMDNVFSSLSFIDSQTGWTAGSDGIMLHTIDGGQSWTVQSTGSQEYISSVFFKDGNSGWAIQGNGSIIGTQDGGVHWTQQHAAWSSYLYDVFFINNQKGWVVGADNSDVWSGKILRTTDGGSTWSSVLLNEGDDYYSVFFIDELNGWIAGGYNYWYGGIVLHTIDGGQSWQTQYQTEKCSHFTDIQFVSPSIGWVVGDMGVVFHTTNGGQSWQQQESGTNNLLNSISFIDENNGWVSGFGGTILQTNNGGISRFHEVQILKASHLSLYPNPCNELLHISSKFDSPTNITVEIVDLLGQSRLLYSGRVPIGKFTTSANLSDLSSGLYLVKLQDGIKVYCEKLIKH